MKPTELIKKIEEIEEFYKQDNLKYGLEPLWDNKYKKLMEIKKMFNKNPIYNYRE